MVRKRYDFYATFMRANFLARCHILLKHNSAYSSSSSFCSLLSGFNSLLVFILLLFHYLFPWIPFYFFLFPLLLLVSFIFFTLSFFFSSFICHSLFSTTLSFFAYSFFFTFSNFPFLIFSLLFSYTHLSMLRLRVSFVSSSSFRVH